MSSNFFIHCFKCQKDYQNQSISRRCHHCKSRDIEVKTEGGSVVDFDNSLIFTYESCDKCNKINKVSSPDLDILPEEIEQKKQELKEDNNWCEGNCKKNDSPNDKEREREREHFEVLFLTEQYQSN